MAEYFLAWAFSVIAILDWEPLWAIAAAIFAVEGTFDKWRKHNG